MPIYSIAEAKNQLPKLVDQAIAGEEVTITRRGKTVAMIIPKVVARKFDAEWFRSHRVETSDPNFDSASFVRAMRDDDRY